VSPFLGGFLLCGELLCGWELCQSRANLGTGGSTIKENK